MWRNTANTFGAIAIVFHWMTATLILVQVPLGLAAVTWRLSPTKLELFFWHKSLGMAVLALTAARLFWRLASGAPLPPAGTPWWQQRAASSSHAMLYVLLLAMPLSGWVINSAANLPFAVFSLIPLPDITAPNAALEHPAKAVHRILFLTLMALVAVHTAAALWHHYVCKDDVLRRMLHPGAGR